MLISYLQTIEMTRTEKIDIMKNKDEMHDKRKGETGAENGRSAETFRQSKEYPKNR